MSLISVKEFELCSVDCCCRRTKSQHLYYWMAPLSLCVNEMISVLQEMSFWNPFSIKGNWIVIRACFKKNEKVHDMCLALKAPNPVLIVLGAHLPSCEGDFGSGDENVFKLLRPKSSSSRTAVQEEYGWRARAALPSLPWPSHTQQVMPGEV